MESNMVSLAETYNSQIKQFVNINLEGFQLIESRSHGPFFYSEFENEELKIIVQGDIGGFEVLTFIEGDKYSLWQYDKGVNKATKTTKENIEYQLNVLKSFLSNDV